MMSQDVPIGVEVETLRPTQMTVGLREVQVKRRVWREADATRRAHLLRSHVIPTVLGPKKRHYIVDHHHFARALLDEAAGRVAVYVLDDLSDLGKNEFWTVLDNSAWCHAYDASGERRGLDDIPKHLGKLEDDPYRSLAAALIRQGAVAKSSRPFSEFLWADFLRRRIEADEVDGDFNAALKASIKLAKNDKARSLPGWCGERPDEL